MAIKASPATGNINASGRVTAAEFAAQSVSAFRVGSGALVEQAMPTTESSSKPISITGIVQWVRGLIGKFYEKPEGGIPKSDLVSSVQTSLNKADAAQPKIDDLNTIRERARTGNEHAGIKDGNPHNTKFADLVAKPTTLTGYGVTAADPATVSAEGGADDNKAADAVKTKQYVEYMVGSNTARFQGEFATADDIPTDVTQYATKTAPTNNDYIVIRDMSEYGKTGNLFSSIDAAVGSINAKGEIDATMTNFRHTTLLPLSEKDGWHIHLAATNASAAAMFRLHAYDANGAWIGQVAVAQSVDGKVEMSGIVPEGTASFRVSYLVNAAVTVFAHEYDGSWRWIYTGEWSAVGKDGWSPAFQMSTEPLTPSQTAALNSGITEDLVKSIGIQLVHDVDANVIKWNDEVITSYAKLLSLVKTGRAVLVGSAKKSEVGSPVIFRPHLVGSTTIYFDATGTITNDGVDGVYTRRISALKSGSDGIVVTETDLTELQKSLTPAQLTNIADVPKKRDRTDMFTEWVADPTSGVSFSGNQPTFSDGVYEWYNSDGLYYYASGDGDEVKIYLHSDDTGTVITATRQRILTTDDVTDDLTNPPAGKAAEAAAVAGLLSGITAQDIADYKMYRGEFAIDWNGYAPFDMSVGDIIGNKISNWPRYSKVKYNIETDGDLYPGKMAEYNPTDGFIKLVYLFGTDNKHLGQTISTLAEAACADNPSASVASLEGRVVPCVSGASGTVDVSFAARKDGDTTLRFFDVLIKDVPSGGCEINLPPTESFVYGNALKAEEGWNHYSFAEFKDGDTYKWAVNRVKMSTSQS